MKIPAFIKASGAFIGVTAMGFVVGSAGGATWGNFDTGILAFLTMLCATASFVGVFLESKL